MARQITLGKDSDGPAHIFFVGPLPPPVHGFSSINQLMLEHLNQRGTVHPFDRAVRPSDGILRNILTQVLFKPLQFLRMSGRVGKAVTYLGLSGGRGQLIDAIYLLISRARGHKLIVHHHSFAYIKPPRMSTRWLLAATKPAVHIVLGDAMRAELASNLTVSDSSIRVVSNAAFQTAADELPRSKSGTDTITLGFLSNITYEKGFEDFFKVVQLAARRGLPIRGVIAGPVSPDAKDLFDQLINETTNVTALGPIYGDAKRQFYREIDVFLFPTRYRNEAEPVVIHEALMHGVYVVANERGCIREMLSNGAGIATAERDFVTSSLAVVEKITDDRLDLQELSLLCVEQERRLRQQGKQELDVLLDTIVEISHRRTGSARS